MEKKYENDLKRLTHQVESLAVNVRVLNDKVNLMNELLKYQAEDTEKTINDYRMGVNRGN